MPWFLVIETATGRLVSQGSVAAAQPPPGLEIRQTPSKPSDSEMWDETTQSFIPRPAKTVRDRFKEFMNSQDISGMNTASKTKIQSALDAVFADVRFD